MFNLKIIQFEIVVDVILIIINHAQHALFDSFFLICLLIIGFLNLVI